MNTQEIDEKIKLLQQYSLELEKLNEEYFHMMYGGRTPGEQEEYEMEIAEEMSIEYEAEYRATTTQEERLLFDIEKKERSMQILHFEIDKFNRQQKSADLEHEPSQNYILVDNFVSEDSFDRILAAKDICKLISSKETRTPLTIGIYGQWGEGKSAFLNLVNDELKKENNINTVKFNASEYDDEEKIWYSLLNCMFSVYEEKVKYPRENYIFRFTKRKLKENKHYYRSMFMWTVALYAIIFIVYVIKDDIFKWSFLGKLTFSVSILQAFNIIVFPFLKLYSDFNQHTLKDSFKNIFFFRYKKKLGTKEEVKDRLNILMDSWIKNEDDKIIILVDELDRCSQRTIDEFFKALELFLPQKNIVYILSINPKTVCSAIAESNSFQLEDNIAFDDKIIFGSEFLEKYINIPFALPSVKDYSRFIYTQLSNDTFSQKEMGIIIELINEISSLKKITPREVKKVLNLLMISKERINTLKQYNYLVDLSEYIPWFILRYFYSKVSAGLVEDMNLVHGSYKFEYVYKKYSQPKNTKEPVVFPKKLNEIINNIFVEYLLEADQISRDILSE